MKVIVNNLAVEYLDEGRGPTLLLLPGWQNTPHNFDALVAELGPGFRIIRLDLPGFGGGSEMPPSDWGVGDYARLVQAFVAKIGLSSYVLVGHSFGGRVSIKGIAEDMLHPEQLVLIASAGIAKHRTLRNRLLTSVAKVGKALLLIPPLSFWRQRLRRALYGKLKSDYLAAGPLSRVYLKTIREDLREYATRVSTPTLLIWGDADEMVPLKDGELFSKLIKNSRLRILHGIGHSPHCDRPKEVADFIKEFI